MSVASSGAAAAMPPHPGGALATAPTSAAFLAVLSIIRNAFCRVGSPS